MFLVRPPPLLGESLSSWRHRSGLMNGFWRYPSPSGFSSFSDPDRLYSEIELRWLQDEFRLTAANIRQLTLESALESLGASLVNCEDLHWILSHRGMVSNMIKAGGPMFCPFCLQSDQIPYFRASWRLAINTHCEIHNCLLEEECPSCGGFIWPVRAREKTAFAPLPFNVCRMCSMNLYKGCPTRLVRNSIERFPLRSNLKGSEIDALWYITQLLLSKGAKHIRDYVAAELGTPELEDLSGTSIRYLSVVRRIPVLAAASWLLEDWPIRLLKVALQCGNSLQTFSATLHLLPQRIQLEILRYLVDQGGSRSDRIIGNDAIREIRAGVARLSRAESRCLLKIAECVMQ